VKAGSQDVVVSGIENGRKIKEAKTSQLMWSDCIEL